MELWKAFSSAFYMQMFLFPTGQSALSNAPNMLLWEVPQSTNIQAGIFSGPLSESISLFYWHIGAIYCTTFAQVGSYLYGGMQNGIFHCNLYLGVSRSTWNVGALYFALPEGCALIQT